MEAFLKGVCQHCGGHLEFPADGIGDSVACPHCGRGTVLKPSLVAIRPDLSEEELHRLLGTPTPDEPSPLRKTVLKLALLLVVLGTILAGMVPAAQWIVKKKIGARQNTSFSQVPGSTLEVLAYTLERPPDGSPAVVVGVATNRSAIRYSAVAVEFDLLNAAGRVIGQTSDRTSVIAAHQTWNFRAPVPLAEATTVRLTGIQGEK